MALFIGTNLPNILLGTVANDIVRGLSGDDILYGFDGHDLLQGGLGDDTLHGGSGNDRLDGGAGEDFFYGGSGIDTVTYLSATAGLLLDLADASLSTGDARGDLFTSIERFELSAFADTFRGISRSETVLAGGGNDRLFGNGGNDSLSGGTGNDRLIGGTGADRLDGGTGTDVASYEVATAAVTLNLTNGSHTGEAAGDVLVSIERLVLGAHDDAVILAGAITYVDGGAGRDTVTGSSGGDTIYGGSGRDILIGNGGNDLIVAGNPAILLPGQDRDSLFGGSGNDTLRGGTGEAFLSGGTGNDSLSGEGGNDTLNGGTGADVLNGGDGTDTVVYDSSVTLNLSAPASSLGAAADDVLTGIEVIEFTNGTSAFIGSGAAVTVRAIGATVTALAGSGAETFQNMASVSYQNATTGVSLTEISDGRLNGAGGAAGDVLFETGVLTLSALNDSLSLNGETITVEADLGGGDDSVSVDGTLGLTLTTGSGADTVTGLGATIDLDMGDGADVVSLISGPFPQTSASILGGNGHDSLSVTDFASTTLEGGIGNDTLNAQSQEGIGSNVRLRGGDGDDLFTGTNFNGSLIVEAGGGNDTMTLSARVGTFEGGEGVDTLNIEIVALESGFFNVDGGAGNDVLNLTQSVPVSVAAPRWVTIMGGAGDDDINGSDIAMGMSGESFEFRTGWGHDTISGFDLDSSATGDDMLVFRGVAGLDDRGDLAVAGDSTHVIFSFGGQSVRIDGIDAAAAADVPIFFFA